jgi:hypothetical protein
MARMNRPSLTPSYYRKTALLNLGGSLFMVLLGLLSAFYLHLRTLWTLLLFGGAVFAFIGVPLRLWMARSIERRSTHRNTRPGDS